MYKCIASWYIATISPNYPCCLSRYNKWEDCAVRINYTQGKWHSPTQVVSDHVVSDHTLSFVVVELSTLEMFQAIIDMLVKGNYKTSLEKQISEAVIIHMRQTL
jgi:hypothetical protein